MANKQSNAYKNDKRNQARALTRQALFISEYIQAKNQSLYNEAAVFYNKINQKYDRKPDLRKTVEFRSWKNRIMAAKGQPEVHIPRPKEYVYKQTQYKDIVISPTTKKPKETSMNLLMMDLNIPLMSIPQHSTTNGIVVQDQAIDPPVGDSVTVETTIEEGDQVPIPFNEDDLLMIDPSITDELMPEIVSQIISDLQADPGLKDLMVGIEKQISGQEDDLSIEEEIPELEIDLPEPNDPLGEELALW